MFRPLAMLVCAAGALAMGAGVPAGPTPVLEIGEDLVIGDFEHPDGPTDVGQWMSWTDRSCCRGSSTAEIEIVSGGANGSSHALAVRGATERNDIWVGAGALFWFKSPADLSARTTITFWARGTGDAYRLFFFGLNPAKDIASTTFVAGAEWKEIVIPLSALAAVDPTAISGIMVGRSEPVGAYALRIDEVRLR